MSSHTQDSKCRSFAKREFLPTLQKLTLSNSTSSLEDAREQLLKLQKDMWINPGTAWWRADFVTYNSNTGLFCFVKITFELMNTGEVKIGFRADTLKGRLYSSSMDLIVLFFEIVAVLLCLTFFARMWFQLLRQHRESKVCVHTRILHRTPHFPLYIQINVQIKIQHNPLIFRCTYKSLYKYKYKYKYTYAQSSCIYAEYSPVVQRPGQLPGVYSGVRVLGNTCLTS
jgi:hypothetical protein